MRAIGLLCVLCVWSALLAVEARRAPGLAAMNQGRDSDAFPDKNMYYSDGFYYYSPVPGTPFYFARPIPGLPNPQMIPPFSLPWKPLPRSPPTVPDPSPSNRLKSPPFPPMASPPPHTVAPPPPRGTPSPPIDRSNDCWGATSFSTSCRNNVCCTTIVYTGTDCSTGTPRPYRKVKRGCSP
ncbi:hypothetical protein L6164_014269 [Bauhinia variegata]|uniref:Uncharacterized protein n=1 Tax=Bauhinia variegata TaxID=167791 RepID=A0ACB9NGQ0_BAUVA|nr:hypothetical protein L6164_014269 [Bauhinia variegata]